MVRNIPRKEEDKINDEYRNSSSERPPPQGAYLFQTHLRGWSLIEMGIISEGGGGI